MLFAVCIFSIVTTISCVEQNESKDFLNIAEKQKKLDQDKLNNDFLNAAINGDYKKIQKLINDGANVNARDKIGRSALCIVAKKAKPTKYSNEKYLKTALVLIKNGIDVKIRTNYTPAHWAASQCNPHMLYFIHKYSGDLDGTNYNIDKPIDTARGRLFRLKPFDPLFPYCMATIDFLHNVRIENSLEELDQAVERFTKQES